MNNALINSFAHTLFPTCGDTVLQLGSENKCIWIFFSSFQFFLHRVYTILDSDNEFLFLIVVSATVFNDCASQVVQWQRIHLPMQGMCVWSLGWEEEQPWSRKWHPTPVFSPGKFHGQRNSVGCSPRGHERVKHDLVIKHQQKNSILAKLIIQKWHHQYNQSSN